MSFVPIVYFLFYYLFYYDYNNTQHPPTIFVAYLTPGEGILVSIGIIIGVRRVQGVTRILHGKFINGWFQWGAKIYSRRLSESWR